VINSALNRQIRRAVQVLEQGGLIAFPTETYYGLGVDPFNARALERLFEVKKRSTKKAVLLLIKNSTNIDPLITDAPLPLVHLMDLFWPGPLTLVFPALSTLPDLLTGNTGTVALRQSPHPCVQEILSNYAGPITGTSANLSGNAPATTANEVKTIFGSAVDCIVDGGATPGGKGSTLVGYDQQLCFLRQGVIPFSLINKKLEKRLRTKKVE